MPLQLTRQGIRLRADERSRQPLLDAYTNATPQGWVKAATQFEVALASGGSLVDVTNLSSVTLAGAPYAAKDGPRAFSRTLAGGALDNTLTETSWAAGGAQHALFIFSAAEMNVPLGGADGADFWFVVTALTQAGDEIVCGTGRLTMRDDGAFGDVGAPPDYPGVVLTVDQGDARYASLGVAGWLTTVTSVGDGAAHSLEALPTAGLALPALRTIYLPTADELQDWLLVASTHATAAGSIQRPADYDATANPRVWFRKR